MRLTQEEPKFDTTSPKILYFGNPVALISSVNIGGGRDSAGPRPREFIMDEHYVDPAKWQALIYDFRHYFALGNELGSTSRFRERLQMRRRPCDAHDKF
jgi:hypothetical protein